jgi:hypothetical protein
VFFFFFFFWRKIVGHFPFLFFINKNKCAERRICFFEKRKRFSLTSLRAVFLLVPTKDVVRRDEAEEESGSLREQKKPI